MGSPSSIQGSVTSATEGRPSAVAPLLREKEVSAAAVSFIFLLFFVSGFAALLYQVIWQRVLAIFSGADVYSVTLIVSAFMAGLGCGSVAGGWIADRVSAVVRIALFACAELAIALFAFFSVDLYYGFLYGSLGFLARSPVTQAGVLFVGLLWPTFFMGMSLPLLARALTSRIDLAAGRIGALYAVNTVGAAVGAFATAWLLTRSLGFEGTVRLGSALNLFCALGASAIAPLFAGERTREVGTRRTAGEPSAESGVRLVGHHPDMERPRFQAAAAEAGSRPDGAVSSRATVWIAIYGLSGFIALSLELVWFRLLGVMLKSTAFTFGTLLTIYLAGLALGTFWGIRRARRTREPARAFLLLQAAIGIYAAASLVVLLALLPELSWLAPLWSYFQSYDPLTVATPLKALANLLLPPFWISSEGIRSVTQLALLYFALPAVLIGPPTVMMGLSFPLLQKTVQKDLAVLGRRVGWLQAANIVGSMLGAMVTGLVLLRFLGTSWTLKLLALVGVSFFLLVHLHSMTRRARRTQVLGSAGILGGTLLLCWMVPDASHLWASLHGATPDVVIHAEDGSGLSVLKNPRPDFTGTTEVFANGLGQSHIPFPDYHVTLGLLPAMMHPDPKRIGVIGLGSGATVFAAGGRPETERITCIEIIAPERTTLEQLRERRRDGGVERLLEDDRVEWVFADGRTVIRLRKERFDILEADALRPTSAYAGNLYSLQYFTLLREHLAPGGFAVTWAPTPRVERTFLKVFPHVLRYRGDIDNMLIGSNEPIEWNLSKLRERLGRPSTRSYYAEAGIDVDRYLERYAQAEIAGFSPAYDRSRLSDLNSDLFPKDEYLVP